MAERLRWIAGAGLALGVVASAGDRVVAQTVERSAQADFTVTRVAAGLSGPWALAFLPGDRFLITEKRGTVRIVGADGTVSEPLDGVPEVANRGQGGLLDVVLHPDFASNGLVYFSYSAGSGSIGTEVARARLGDGRLEDWQVLFRMEPKVGGGRHFGSRMLFAPDGTLYASFGDRGQRHEAQDAGNHIGTIIRLEEDGALPIDNPFIDSTTEKAEIWSYGHRNVQGMALHPETGVIWAHEHGPRGGDEVNIIRIGANYGWPAITYGEEYSGGPVSEHTELPDMEQPVIYWVPSIAPSGMAFYDGDRFPEWKGDLFVGALRGRHLRRLELDGEEVVEQEALLKDRRERIRDVRSGPDGFLYVLTDGPDASLLRLEPAGQ